MRLCYNSNRRYCSSSKVLDWFFALPRMLFPQLASWLTLFLQLPLKGWGFPEFSFWPTVPLMLYTLPGWLYPPTWLGVSKSLTPVFSSLLNVCSYWLFETFIWTSWRTSNVLRSHHASARALIPQAQYSSPQTMTSPSTLWVSHKHSVFPPALHQPITTLRFFYLIDFPPLILPFQTLPACALRGR